MECSPGRAIIQFGNTEIENLITGAVGADMQLRLIE
jgi:hypothetical protein